MGGSSVDFSASLIGAPDIPFQPDIDKRVSGNMDFFFRHEYKTFIQYIPDGSESLYPKKNIRFMQ
jgi:hypothetical protein